jgi:hypothetical protein
MLETLAVFQPSRFWLNADAKENICEQHRRNGAQSVPAKRTAPQVDQGARRMSHRSKHEQPRQAIRARTLQLNAAPTARGLKPPPSLTSAHAGDRAERTEDMLETLAVFQPARFWSNADAE